MKAVDVMTRAMVTVPPGASIVDAMRLMLGQRISGLPVTDDVGHLVGILTEGDLLRRAETGTAKNQGKWMQFLHGPARQARGYVRTHGRRVEEIMTSEVVTVAEGAPLDEVVDLMESRQIRRIPVVTDGRLVGVVSRADLLRALVRELEKVTPVAASDSALREQIVAELRRHDWGGHSQVTVVVTEGVVYLEGVVDEQERTAIKVAAENVAGVKEVRDHLDALDPTLYLTYGF